MNAPESIVSASTDWLRAPEKVPPEMAAMRRWLLWKLVPAGKPGGKPRKMPVYADGSPRRGKLNSPEDRAQWVTLAEALDAARRQGHQAAPGRPGVAGVGFTIINDESRVTCVDLDNCLDDNGEFTGNEHQLAIVVAANAANAVIEVSQSGHGLHIWGRSNNRFDGKPTRIVDEHGVGTTIGVEVFGANGYIALTGEAWGGSNSPLLGDSELVDITAVVDLAQKAIEKSRGPREPKRNQSANDATSNESNADPMMRFVTDEQAADLVSALAAIPSDDRDLWVRMGHALKGVWSNDDPDLGHTLFFEWSEKSDFHDPEADERTWKSFRGQRTGYPAIFAEAQRRGWVNPRAGGGQVDPAAEVPEYANFMTLTTSPPRPRQWVVEEWLPRGTVTALFGPGGIGKTLLAQQIATAIARGEAIFGAKVAPGAVLGYLCEDDNEELRRRQIDLLALDVPDGLDRLHLQGRAGKGNVLAMFNRDNTMTLLQFFQMIEAECARVRPALLILDNIAQMFAGAENDRHAVTAFCNALTGLALRFDCAVLLLGHVAKAEGSQFSGSTAWDAAVRSRLLLERREKDGYLTLSRKKSNYAALTEVVLEYREGMLVTVNPALAEAECSPALEAAKAAVLAAYDHLFNLQVSCSQWPTARSYLPKLAKDKDLLGGISIGLFSKALDVLVSRGVLVPSQNLPWKKSDRKPAVGLLRAEGDGASGVE